MEVPSTPEERATHFAGIARGKSGRIFSINTDDYGGPSSCGVTIERRDGESFQITSASGITDSLDDEASNLGGERIAEYGVIYGGSHFPTAWYGCFEFSASRLEKTPS